MSICVCEDCDAYIDSDFDCDCFVEIGNMRRLHKEIILCERCRDKRGLWMDDQQQWQESVNE